MTVPIQNLRSGTASKRPVATGLAVGQIAVNYNEADPAIYLRGDADALIKVSPTFVGSSAPNTTPASGGASGNSKGETWLDTSASPATLKVWDGSTWVAGYTLASGVSIQSPTLVDATLSGTVTFPSGVVTSDAIANGTIVDADISASAAIAYSKLSLSNGIVNSDIAGNAAIGLSKLATGALPSGITISTNNIVDGTIVNADIGASAAIADTKLATISTAGKVSNSATTATSSNTANAIIARGSSGEFTAGVITAGGLTLGNNNISTIKTATFNSQINLGSTSGTINIDWSAAQNYRQPQPVGTITYTFTNPSGPGHFQLFIDNTGTAQTINWPGSVIFMGSTWSGENSKRAVINFWYDGSSTYLAVGINQA